MSFGERLKQVRKANDMTQGEFAKALHVSTGHISNLEKGRSNPSDMLITAICFKFLIYEEWLRKGEGYMNIGDNYSILLPWENPIKCRESEDAYLDELAHLFSPGFPYLRDIIATLSPDEEEACVEHSPQHFVWLLNLLIREWGDGTKRDKIKIEVELEEIIPERKRTIYALAERIPSTLYQLEIDDNPIMIVNERSVIAAGGDVCVGDYGVIAVDDSMIDAGIQRGDLCIVRPMETIENGEIALVYIDSHSTLRKFYHEDGHYRIVPCNPQYYERIYEESESIRIFGKFVKVMHSRY